MWAHVFGGITPFSVGLIYNSIFFLAVCILSHFGTHGTVGTLASLTFFFPFSSLAHLFLFHFDTANVTVHACFVSLPSTSLMAQYSFLFFFIFQNDKLIFQVCENALEHHVEY